MTIRGTVHISPSDFAILYPHVCSFLLKTTVNPRRALDLHVNASLEYLRMICPQQTADIAYAFPDEGLLVEDVNLLDQIPTAQLHKPHEKYTAARLKIDNEWKWRLAPRLKRRTGKKERLGEKGCPKDEVWVHTKPDEEDVRRYHEKRPDARRLDERKAVAADGGVEQGNGKKAAVGDEADGDALPGERDERNEGDLKNEQD